MQQKTTNTLHTFNHSQSRGNLGVLFLIFQYFAQRISLLVTAQTIHVCFNAAD